MQSSKLTQRNPGHITCIKPGAVQHCHSRNESLRIGEIIALGGLMRYDGASATEAVDERLAPVEYVVDLNGVIEARQVGVLRFAPPAHVEVVFVMIRVGSSTH
jgi:hypothetical protein